MKKWYLLQSPYDQVSGFEGEALSEFGEEGFLEVLESEFAVTVEICNYDLSECVEKRVVIQNNHQDTKLKTMSRAMLAPIGTCKAGMYVHYKNRYWLIVGIVDDNKVYEKAILLICNFKLSWLDKNGKPVQRWINAESASQYNNGESNMAFYFVRSDQLMVYMPDDEQVLTLNSGERFIIDKRCVMYEKSFDESVVVDTSNPVIVYELTRSDTVLDDYTDSGIVGFIMTQREQHKEDGYYLIDGVGYWLCGTPTEDVERKLTCDIICDSDELYIDLDPGVYKAAFYDADGNEVTVDDYSFYVDSDVAPKLDVQKKDNLIMVTTSDYDLNNKTFKLVLEADGYEPTTKIIKIREFL